MPPGPSPTPAPPPMLVNGIGWVDLPGPGTWTPAERTALLALRQAGLRNAEIAARLGRTERAVDNMLCRLIPRRRRPSR